MHLLDVLAYALLLVALGVAVGSVITALRSATARTATRGAALCLGTAVLVVVLGIAGTVWGLSTAFDAVGAVDPAMRAQLLAQGISEAMNCTAFAAVGAVPLLGCAIFLFVRAARLRRA